MWRAGAGEGYRNKEIQEPGLTTQPVLSRPFLQAQVTCPSPNPDLVAQGVLLPSRCVLAGFFLVSPHSGTHSRALVTARGEKRGRCVRGGWGGSGEGVSSLSSPGARLPPLPQRLVWRAGALAGPSRHCHSRTHAEECDGVVSPVVTSPPHRRR